MIIVKIKRTRGGGYMLVLPNGDYENIINFMDEMANPILDFRTHVLKTFDKIFGFRQSNFWIIDDNKHLINPISLNIDQQVMSDYLNGGFHWDYHLPKYIHPQLTRQRVLRLEDIISLEQYEQETYYKEFMCRHDLYHQMTAYLMDQDKLLGGIAFLKSKSDKPFTLNDIKNLEIITRYLSQWMANFQEDKQAKEINDLTKARISEKEFEVIALVQKGLSNQEIAEILYISIHTVKKHLQNIYQKLNVPNRTSLCYKLQSNQNNFSYTI